MNSVMVRERLSKFFGQTLCSIQLVGTHWKLFSWWKLLLRGNSVKQYRWAFLQLNARKCWSPLDKMLEFLTLIHTSLVDFHIPCKTCGDKVKAKFLYKGNPPMAATARCRMVHANGLRMRIAEEGDPSKPLVLLMHGWPEFWCLCQTKVDAGWHFCHRLEKTLEMLRFLRWQLAHVVKETSRLRLRPYVAIWSDKAGVLRTNLPTSPLYKTL